MTMRVPFAASSVALARQRLKSWLVSADFADDVVDDARVVVSELVANAVRHAQPLAEGDLVVAWSMEPRGLRVSVTDGGSGTRPRAVHARAGAMAGRGLAIIEQLSTAWWTEKDSSRSTVYVVLPA